MMLLFMACVQETIPNKATIAGLTNEQKDIIYNYTHMKCERQVNLYMNNNKYKKKDTKTKPLTHNQLKKQINH